MECVVAVIDAARAEVGVAPDVELECGGNMSLICS
jgi:hypothetical protein